jgi:hypothetical protein
MSSTVVPYGGGKGYRPARPIDIAYFERTDFWANVGRQAPTDCWLWTKSVGSHGYGQAGRGFLAHRVAWALTNGPIPDNLTIDHICRERRCCNPAHLRPMENVENARMNGNFVKTHCKRGHEFTPENTRTNERGHRWCRTCGKLANDARPKPPPKPEPDLVERECDGCGALFSVPDAGPWRRQIYCGTRCNQAAYRTRVAALAEQITEKAS